jgi:hypothetical protein
MRILGAGTVSTIFKADVLYRFIAWVAEPCHVLAIPRLAFMFDEALYGKLLGNLSRDEFDAWQRCLEYPRTVDLFTLELDAYTGWTYSPNPRTRALGREAARKMVAELLSYKLVDVHL